jgi:hypothetical protein
LRPAARLPIGRGARAAAAAAGSLDQLLAPIALYPDQLLAQILMCAGNPAKVADWSCSSRPIGT